MRPATLTRLHLYGCLALAPVLACAQTGPPLAPQHKPGTEGGDVMGDAAGGPPLPSGASPMRGVRQLSDSELSCAQIYAQTQALETSSRQQQAEVLKAQEAATAAQNEMARHAGDLRGAGMGAAVGSAIGSGLLGLIPGASQVQGYAMKAAASARRAQLQENINQMMQAQAQWMALEQALEHTQARSEHLTDLFLRKACRLSQEQTAADRAP